MGWRAVTITHGDVDSGAEMAAIQAVVDHARSRSPRLGIVGGCDFVTLRLPGPGADDVVSEVAEVARGHARRYQLWQVDLTRVSGVREGAGGAASVAEPPQGLAATVVTGRR